MPKQNFCSSPIQLDNRNEIFSCDVVGLINQALQEDLMGGDITSLCTIPKDKKATALWRAKESLLVCGLPLAEAVFSAVDPRTSFESFVDEGSFLPNPTEVFRVKGSPYSLLAAERVALNFLQHLSGVASLAYRYAEAVKGTQARIVDTRKTIPGLRTLQKYAVRTGGCFNHRWGLHSGILIKENHIRAAGSLTKAVKAAQENAPHTLRIEVEVTNFEELEEALNAGADIILLDNMNLQQLKQAVHLVNHRVLLEASGGITLESVRAVAETGVDLISVGALTHSVQAVDLSMTISEK